MTEDRVTISMHMLRKDLDDLTAWAKDEHLPVTEILRRALKVYRFLLNENADGTDIILKQAGHPDRQLLIEAVN